MSNKLLIALLALAGVIVLLLGAVLAVLLIPIQAAQSGVPTASATLAQTSRGVLSVPVKRVFNHQREITVEYDRIVNVTVVSLKIPYPKISAVPNQIQANASYTGTKPILPDAVSLSFVTNSPEKQFPTQFAGTALLDDTTRHSFLLGNVPQFGKGYVIEALLTRMPMQEFLRMLNAKKVEMKIFTSEFQLEDEQLEALRDFASRLSE